MFKRVLIAEDQESANISVQTTLAQLGVTERDYVYYCDDALMRIKKGVKAGEEYDLLITDLYFEEDDRAQTLSGGMELIRAVKEEQPSLKIVVFSAVDKPALVDCLFKEYHIDGYVPKGRRDAQDLKQALDAICQNKKYLSPKLKQGIQEKNSYEFSKFDVTIISLLSKGMRQKDIPAYLQQKNIRPSGLSTIEKRLNQMKEILGFSKNEQLVAFCKDMGII